VPVGHVGHVKSACTVLVGKLEEKVHFRDLGTKERILLNWVYLFFKSFLNDIMRGLVGSFT
jgi:hypothetical protein